MPYKIQREQVDRLLSELAKEFRKQNGKNRDVEMIIVGGGSILINYGFRDYTDDFDYLSRDSRALQDASIPVRDKYELEYHWINGDFRQTPSYSDKLYQFSSHYKSFNNGRFEVRTVKGEYLVAMKMVSGRRYKTDLSDILGIMVCEARDGNPMGADRIRGAHGDLYGGRQIDDDIWRQVEKWCSMDIEGLEAEYEKVREHERYYAEVVRDEVSMRETGVSMADIAEIIEKAYQQATKGETSDIEKPRINSEGIKALSDFGMCDNSPSQQTILKIKQ